MSGIPLAEVLAYCELYGIAGEEREEFVHLVGVADSVFMERANRQSKDHAPA